MNPVPSVYQTLRKSAYIPEITLLIPKLNRIYPDFFISGFKGQCLVRGACPTVENNTLPVISHTQASGSAGLGCLLVLISCSKSPAALENSFGSGMVEVTLSPDEFPLSVCWGCSDEPDPGVFNNTSGPLGAIGIVSGFIFLCTKVPCLWKGKQR